MMSLSVPSTKASGGPVAETTQKHMFPPVLSVVSQRVYLEVCRVLPTHPHPPPSPFRSQISPWFSTLCTATTANGYPCNPPGGYNANDSANCSGIATDNFMDVVLVSPVATNTPPSYLFCDPSVYRMNNLSYISKDTLFFQFLDATNNNLGVKPTSPVYSLQPDFRSCDRQSVGPTKQTFEQYIGRFNIPKPSSFAKVMNLDSSQIQDIYYNP